MKPQSAPIGKGILIGVACLLAALILWSIRNWAAAQAAASVMVTAEFTTVTEPDDARITRAFSAARQTHPADATFEPLPNQTRVRHTRLTVRAPGESQAVAGLQQLTGAMTAIFEKEGPGQLNVSLYRRGRPVLDEHTASVKHVFQGAAIALGLLGFFLILPAWRRRQPESHGIPASFWLLVAGMLAVALAPWLLDASLLAVVIMLVPTAIAARLCYGVMKTQRAARWPSTVGRITRSRLSVAHRQRSEEGTEAVNVPSIEYEFTLGPRRYTASKISAIDKAGRELNAQATLDRYPVGATVQVHYNPDNPSEAVLEHDLPLPAATMYAIAAAIFLAGVAAVFAFANVDPIMGKLREVFPPGAEPQFTLFFALGALLLMFIQWSSYREARRAVSWPVTPGRVVASRVESYTTSVGGRSGNRVTLFQPVVEYAYIVKDREFHSTQLRFGARESTGRDLAEARAARYPAGSEVPVHYDPQNPSNAVLDVKVAFGALGWALAVLFIGLAVYFSAVLRGASSPIR
jgi:hypothetical protein